MNLLSDVVTYVRRIIKTSSNQQITDALIMDYINRFYAYDVPARVQLFDLKTTWQLITTPLVDRYNLPYDANGIIQYQGLLNPVYCNGVNLAMVTQPQTFFNSYPNFQEVSSPAVMGAGSTVSFTATGTPMLRATIDMIGELCITNHTVVPFSSLKPGVWISSTNTSAATVPSNSVTLVDSPFSAAALNGAAPATKTGNQGYLVYFQQPPNVYPPITATYTDAGTINYSTGAITATFPAAATPPAGSTILMTSTPFDPGTPRIILFYNNMVTIRPVPDISYMIEFTAYLTPCTFLATGNALPFGYMSEYLARGAARKILSDVGDMEQFAFYEPLFREQECLVIRRSDRQKSVERTSTIFTDINQQQPWNFTSGQGI